MAEAGQPAPEYWQNEFMVYATIRQHGDVVGQLNDQLNGQLNGQLNESQKETLEFIRAHEGYNTTKIAEGLGKPFRTIDKHINVLIELNLIVRRGSKKTGGYYVIEE
jgi:ATP-dependent DNA helicase RecG